MQAPVDNTNKPKPPTKIANDCVRYLVGFGVGVAIGLAPYLGDLDIPLFTPLLSLIPATLQDTVIPLSAAIMGVVAVVIEWYGRERITLVWLRKMFNRTLIIALSAFLILISIHTLYVVRIPIDGASDAVSFVVGLERPLREPCTENISDAECIKLLTFDPSLVSSFWGDRSIRTASLMLMLAYLVFTSTFGSLVGLVLLRNRRKDSTNT